MVRMLVSAVLAAGFVGLSFSQVSAVLCDKRGVACPGWAPDGDFNPYPGYCCHLHDGGLGTYTRECGSPPRYNALAHPDPGRYCGDLWETETTFGVEVCAERISLRSCGGPVIVPGCTSTPCDGS